jgi:hypothetical protein
MRRSILSHSEGARGAQAHKEESRALAVTHRLGVGLLASTWWRQLARRRPPPVFGTWRVAARDRSSADVGHGNGVGWRLRELCQGGRAIGQRSMFGAEHAPHPDGRRVPAGIRVAAATLGIRQIPQRSIARTAATTGAGASTRSSSSRRRALDLALGRRFLRAREEPDIPEVDEAARGRPAAPGRPSCNHAGMA